MTFYDGGSLNTSLNCVRTPLLQNIAYDEKGTSLNCVIVSQGLFAFFDRRRTAEETFFCRSPPIEKGEEALWTRLDPAMYTVLRV